MLRIFTWKWGTKYHAGYVERLARGLAKNLSCEYDLTCMSDTKLSAQGLPGARVLRLVDKQGLTKIKGCYVRLQMFSREFQQSCDVAPGERMVCIDLDCVVTGKLDSTFDRNTSFTILQGANSSNPCPFNGSLWTFVAGKHQDLWSEFSIRAASRVPYYEFPDDQGWMHARMPNADGWLCGPSSGIWSFRKRGWPSGDALPDEAKIVFFPGGKDPSQVTSLDWVRENWR